MDLLAFGPTRIVDSLELWTYSPFGLFVRSELKSIYFHAIDFETNVYTSHFELEEIIIKIKSHRDDFINLDREFYTILENKIPKR